MLFYACRPKECSSLTSVEEYQYTLHCEICYHNNLYKYLQIFSFKQGWKIKVTKQQFSSRNWRYPGLYTVITFTTFMCIYLSKFVCFWIAIIYIDWQVTFLPPDYRSRVLNPKIMFIHAFNLSGPNGVSNKTSRKKTPIKAPKAMELGQDSKVPTYKYHWLFLICSCAIW